LLEPIFKPLRPFADSRGYSFFDIFGEPTSGQINVGNLVGPAIKAFHYHKLQWDHWFCMKGDIHVVVVNPCYSGTDPDNLTLDLEYSDIRHFYIGEHNPGVISIPPGWWHGYCNVSQDSTLLYWVTKAYVVGQADEFRIPWDVFGADFWKPENK
jgi:dTDP-4-dehydrorhamnose 3,5-epimerase